MREENKQSIGFVSITGMKMMTVEKVGRDGDRLAVHGNFMDSVPITMYVLPNDVPKMFGLFLNRKNIGYMLALPLILLKKRLSKNADL